MFARKADARMDVQVPTSAQDHPSWSKVGVIAAIGFLVGIAWPRLAGVRLGPSVPADVSSASAQASAAVPSGEPSVPSAPAMAAVPAAPPSQPTAAASAPPAVNASVGHGVVFACRTADGDSLKGADCGSLPGLDGQVMSRLRKLSECGDAAGASGKLHLVLHLDFARSALSADLGKGNALSGADAILTCAKADLAGASLSGIPHENPRYSVAYTVTFAPGGSSAEPVAAAATAAAAGDEASAQVVWDVAIVRDAPKTGKVTARLQRGTTVHLGAARDGWYPVKFGDGFGSDGWLYRGAIGR